MQFVDLHCDTILEVCKDGMPIRSRSGHVNLERMQRAGYVLQTFAMFVNLKQYPDAYTRCMEMMDVFDREMEANADVIRPVTSYAQIQENRRQGRMSALLSVEEGEACMGQVEHLRKLYDRGVRMMTLTWNYANTLAHPNHVNSRYGVLETEYGLTEQGIACVEEMERLGILIDVSHLGDAGFADVAVHTRKPFLASHSNARSICPHVRNLTDSQIRVIAQRGGVMGLNFCGDFVDPAPEGGFASLEKLAGMARYMIQTGGVESVALGSDFDGIGPELELKGCQDMPVLAEALEHCGFTHTEVENMCYRNAMRLFREML